MAKTLFAWSIQTAVAMGFYLLFAGKISMHEVIAGVFSAALAGTLSEIVRQRGVVWFQTNARNVAQLWRMPKYMFTGTWEILVVLFRQLVGGKPAESLLLAVPFDDGDDTPEGAARRALAVGYTTATPNFIVLGIDRERHLLVYHQIQRSPVLEMTKRLGAKVPDEEEEPRRSRPTPRPRIGGPVEIK